MYVHVYPVAPSSHIFTKDDTACYHGVATLEAWSDWAEPYTIRWYKDQNLTTLLKEETVTSPGGHSTCEISEFTYSYGNYSSTVYLTLEKEGYCPTTYNGIATQSIFMSNDTIVLDEGQTYRFYDSGGPTGDHGAYDNYKQVITSGTGRPLTIKFDEIDIGTNSTIRLYKGKIASDSFLKI